MKAALPANEAERLEALRRYEILDSAAEQAYDDITLMASHIAGTPIAVISLIDRDRQWFKSKVGLTGSETPRDLAFCAHAILTPDAPLLVPDATREDRFADNLLVTGPPHIRFYFGVPLVTSDRMALGTLCAIDLKPRNLGPEQVQALQALSRQVMKLLELRRNAAELRQAYSDLERARDEAQAASRAKSMFLASMSHDIRTPIAGVLGTAELLLDTELSAEQREHVENLRVSADSLLGLINDILDLSKVEAGKLELDPYELPIRPFVEDVLRIVAFPAHQKGLNLTSRVEEAVPGAVILDGARVRQILVNLLGNAIKFTAQGEVALDVSSGGGELTFSVRDTGPGIPASRQQGIFDAFAQADRTVARRFGGTGLGLTISKRLVEAMGGCIRLESEPGRGSVFQFSIPAAKAGGGTAGRPAEPEAPSEVKPLTVLVAEDHPVIQRILALQLKKQGHTAEIVRNGREAFEAVQARRFDAVLMDVEMPEMDGLEATAAIRRWEAGTGRHIPILAMTAHAMAEDERRCLDAGMDGYLSKPVRPAELFGELRRFTS
jgi:signal transduction histidine kinase/CheY-like chemotaxis protein